MKVIDLKNILSTWTEEAKIVILRYEDGGWEAEPLSPDDFKGIGKLRDYQISVVASDCDIKEGEHVLVLDMS